MNPQYQVLLSLGSNQGNRLENIEQAIALIHQEVATVVLVSSMYESDSWGFESDLFYNCAIAIHTNLSPLKLLKKILKLEQKLGRIRTESPSYQPRVIDIDIIAYGDEVVETEFLQVPHPHYHL
jgi:2-amino-4-hydroxy-6-hydroxymethyldihydropteridine diphosphokinase